MTGEHPYASAEFALSLGHIGRPHRLHDAGTSVLLRQIGAGPHRDATGPYPFCVIGRVDIANDLAGLAAAGAVSLTLVSDPFFGPRIERLTEAFDIVRPLKTLFVNNPSRKLKLGEQHRRNTNKALAVCTVSRADLAKKAELCASIYTDFAVARRFVASQLFPVEHFRRLALVPGAELHLVEVGNDVVGFHIWMMHRGVVYSHLTAMTAEGRARRSGFALSMFALEAFKDQEKIVFGGSAGVTDTPNDGLGRFKSGFSNETTESILCGKVLRPADYRELSVGVADDGPSGAEFFPKYRQPAG